MSFSLLRSCEPFVSLANYFFYGSKDRGALTQIQPTPLQVELRGTTQATESDHWHVTLHVLSMRGSLRDASQPNRELHSASHGDLSDWQRR